MLFRQMEVITSGQFIESSLVFGRASINDCSEGEIDREKKNACLKDVDFLRFEMAFTEKSWMEDNLLEII